MSEHGRRVVGCPLPGAKLPYLKLVRPGPGLGGAIEGWVLSPLLMGAATHYVGKRTIPCTKHIGECEGCDFWQQAPRWDGFLAVLCKTKRQAMIFQVSRGAADACEQLDKIESLRGLYVTLRRKGESTNGAVMMTFREEAYRGILPPVPDVPGALERLWGVCPAFIGRTFDYEGKGVTQ